MSKVELIIITADDILKNSRIVVSFSYIYIYIYYEDGVYFDIIELRGFTMSVIRIYNFSLDIFLFIFEFNKIQTVVSWNLC